MTKDVAKAKAFDDVLSFIPYMSFPDLKKPKHLESIGTIINDIIKGEMRRVSFHVPPQHGKSKLLLHGIASYLYQNPKKFVAYIGYAQTFAQSQTRTSLRLMDALKIESIVNKQNEYITKDGGGLLTSSIDGVLTGYPIDWLIVDDPIASPLQAESKVYRERLWDWWERVAKTRLRPKTSLTVVHCLTGDSNILMSNKSQKKLKDVIVGDYVATYNIKDNCIENKQVLNVLCQGIDNVIEIKTPNNTLKGNKEHPILAYRNRNLEFVKIKDLQVGDYIQTNIYNPNGIENDISTNELWLLGFMFGDGWITKHPNKLGSMRYVTCVATKKYIDRNNKVDLLFKELYGIDLKPTKYGYRKTEKICPARRLFEIGFNGKAKTKRIPPYIFGLSVEKRAAFLDGFMNADGTTGKDKLQRIGLCNLELLEDLKLLVTSLGYKTSNITTETTYHKPPNSKAASFHTLYRMSFGNVKSTNQFELRKIVSIKQVEPELVYDLTVQDNENYIANGIVVHNTRWHKDDLIGRLIDTKYAMTHIRLPALYDGLDAYGKPEKHQKEIDSPLWSEFGYDYYDEIRRSNEYTWQSLYQGLPISRGNAIFKDVTFYSELPSEYKIQIGVDLAYSERTKSDYSVAVVIAVANGKYYILDVIRWQKEFNYSIELLANLYNKYLSKLAMENNGVQKAICDMVETKLGYNRITRINPTQDKVTRATEFSSQWNLGNVLVPNPEIYPNNWLSDYIDEIQSFTGIKDKHDDQVDASVYAFMNKGYELGDMIMI